MIVLFQVSLMLMALAYVIVLDTWNDEIEEATGRRSGKVAAAAVAGVLGVLAAILGVGVSP